MAACRPHSPFGQLQSSSSSAHNGKGCLCSRMILLSRAFSSPGVGEWGLLRLNQVTVSGMGQQVGQQKGVCVRGGVLLGVCSCPTATRWRLNSFIVMDAGEVSRRWGGEQALGSSCSSSGMPRMRHADSYTHLYEHHHVHDDVLSTYPTEDMEWTQRSPVSHRWSRPSITGHHKARQASAPTLCSSPFSSPRVT